MLRTTTSLMWLLSATVVAPPVSSTAADTIHVDGDAPPGGDGGSWETALNDLQQALGVAVANDVIRIAAGTYIPDPTGLPDPRDATFSLVRGVTLVGGYAGSGHTDPDERDIVRHRTMLSGDLAGNDDIDDVEWWRHPSMNDNCFRVVTSIGTNELTSLVGVTIMGGHGRSYLLGGGGLYNFEGSPKLVDCTFFVNQAERGGAMFSESGSPTLVHCTFNRNYGEEGAGVILSNDSMRIVQCTFLDNIGYDGCAAVENSGSVVIIDSEFVDNVGYDSVGGGGVFNCGIATLTNCVFFDNYHEFGGGVANEGDMSLVNCLFHGNRSGPLLGGLFAYGPASTLVVNSTFCGNNGGITHWGAGGTLKVFNSILWANGETEEDQIKFDPPVEVTVSNSCIQGLDTLAGNGNIGEDPSFIIPGYFDDRGTPGKPWDDIWVPGDYRLRPDSPCIDTGDTGAVPPDILDLDGDGLVCEPVPIDLDGAPRLTDGDGDEIASVDMGSYESQSGGRNGNIVVDDRNLAADKSEDCNSNGLPDRCDIFHGTSADCNRNHVPDECDVAAGTSADCNGNGLPDECEPDCNGSGEPDDCDVAAGTSADCNGNDLPDECDLLDGRSEDCNHNEVPDECDVAAGTGDDCNSNGMLDECEPDCNGSGAPDDCDVAAGTSADCNGNDLPDECDLFDGRSEDCNHNEVPDECDVAAGTGADCNSNGLPDECDVLEGTSEDCNHNEVPDDCDVAAGTSADCNDNEMPDECDPDCNGSGAPDDCDVAAGTSEDCNDNEVPDECDPDCDSNGSPDDCDVAAGTAPDCNHNGIPDECDIGQGTSTDLDGNGCPDECDPVITQQPQDNSQCFGFTVIFSVVADGIDLTYQWHKDGIPLVGGTTIWGVDEPTVTIAEIGYGDEGDYTCIVSGECASEESVPGVLLIINPIFVRQPADACVELGGTAMFEAEATLPPPEVVGYRWKKDGELLSDGGDIAGAITDTLTIHNVSKGDTGQYSVLAFSMDPVCFTESTPAALKVLGLESPDCNGNEIPDECEAGGSCESDSVCPTSDVNCDHVADGFDIAVIRNGANWLLPTEFASQLRADVNCDGIVDGSDIAEIRGGDCWLQ